MDHSKPQILTVSPAIEETLHISVLLEETIALLRPAKGHLILDGTVGGGGHAQRFLQAGARVIGLDRDTYALEQAQKYLEPWSQQLTLIQSNYAEIAAVLQRLEIPPATLNAALLDLGVSSYQLDHAHRGFSFLKEGPLDMRMGNDTSLTAADLINTASQKELANIFWQYGDEPAAHRISRYLCQQRQNQPFTSTLQLADAISCIVPRTGKRHPATRIFQALRIAVNQELQALEHGLDAISHHLAPGGRLGIITFHSGEDRLVKHYFKQGSQPWIDAPEWSKPKKNPAYRFQLLTPHPVTPSPEELAKNPKSRSAKLRVAERLLLSASHS